MAWKGSRLLEVRKLTAAGLAGASPALELHCFPSSRRGVHAPPGTEPGQRALSTAAGLSKRQLFLSEDIHLRAFWRPCTCMYMYIQSMVDHTM